ncbi:acyl-CoA carboxylase subunit epsilon [Nesterenkonia ebinurensis]|uniref:acyl-CoA carboxylase subunit epsilon n=1 Tax=Nesterenkonia ebinurensis TaxID=2608252 RepID=UPI00123DE626|nr:acyl-CoA carboxylase subunit epsilon [Nesterenkonia ebinurensis]
MSEDLLPVRGAELTEEETAAVVAVLATLAAGETANNDDAGSTGPVDRTIQRKHRLQGSQHGLWGRPGPTSWYQATGGLR